MAQMGLNSILQVAVAWLQRVFCKTGLTGHHKRSGHIVIAISFKSRDKKMFLFFPINESLTFAPQFRVKNMSGRPQSYHRSCDTVYAGDLFFLASLGVFKVLGGKKELHNEVTPVTFSLWIYICVYLMLSRCLSFARTVSSAQRLQ